eukprot:m51a1_g504 putative pre-mrna-splicing factor 18 (458) ;mRNA; r:287061-290435
MLSSLASLRGEIEKKRKAEAELRGRAAKRFVTKADLEREQREQALRDAQEHASKEEAEKKALLAQLEKAHGDEKPAADATGAAPGDVAQAEGAGGAEAAAAAQAADVKIPLPVLEVMRRLRQRNQPITLFAEDDRARYERLRKLEEEEAEKKALLAQLEKAHGDEKPAADATGAAPGDVAQAEGAGGAEAAAAAQAADVKIPLPVLEVMRRLRQRNQPITLFAEDDRARYERLRKLEEREPMEYVAGTDNDMLKRLRAMDREEEQGSKAKPAAISATPEPRGKLDDIEQFFDGLLDEWAKALESRAHEERRTSEGKKALAKYQECRANIQPFFHQLRARQVPSDVHRSVARIVSYLRQREYVKANDVYLQLSIGNAPWPMGVTMVGIHERSAREKIFSNQVAHILNDETTRKYLQAIKRLMTFCQNLHPADPSKCVEYCAQPRPKPLTPASTPPASP